jgi:hypothetical protein
LKTIGLVLLLASMVGSGVFQRDLPPDLADADMARLTAVILLEVVSWAAIPIYAWLLCSGLAHTRSAGRYAARLAVLAVVSEAPYDLATSGQLWDMSSQNPVFALLVSLAVLALGRDVKGPQAASRGSRAALWGALLIGGALWLLLFNVGLRLGIMPTGVVILAFALVFQFLWARPNTMMFAGTAVGVLGGIFPAFGLVFLHFRNDRAGMRHKSTRLVFYALYPLCLLAAGLYRTLAP